MKQNKKEKKGAKTKKEINKRDSNLRTREM